MVDNEKMQPFGQRGGEEMKIVDLTHLITEEMNVFPGSNQPELKKLTTYEDGYVATQLTMESHVGTHMDSPAHVVEGQPWLDQLEAEQFVGKALVVDCSDFKAGEQVSMKALEPYAEKISKVDFVLFNMGWAKYWNTPDYLGDFPVISKDVVEFVANSHLKGIGFDTISVDPIGSLERHNLLLSNKLVVIVENLTNLDKVGNDIFTFMALPMKFEKSDGAPVRAIAIVE